MASNTLQTNAPPHRRSGDGTRNRTLLMLPVLLLLVALQSACAMPWQDERPGPVPQDEMETVLLEVDNRNFLDARIYLVWNGVPDRAGVVTGNTQDTLIIESRTGDLQIQVDFVAGGTRITDPIQVWGGDTVELLIPAGDQPLMAWTS